MECIRVAISSGTYGNNGGTSIPKNNIGLHDAAEVELLS